MTLKKTLCDRMKAKWCKIKHLIFKGPYSSSVNISWPFSISAFRILDTICLERKILDKAFSPHLVNCGRNNTLGTERCWWWANKGELKSCHTHASPSFVLHSAVVLRRTNLPIYTLQFTMQACKKERPFSVQLKCTVTWTGVLHCI